MLMVLFLWLQLVSKHQVSEERTQQQAQQQQAPPPFTTRTMMPT